ncbi:hypothetical protein BMETH_2502_0 [methanotrophic bacterial endosymbiont of Bathymodiolus sp.]|nr:hypothetical protein BMETH_2502_0 [methanotrophic bacterial endosymbiont of Bathymodiolus sp.]
MAIIHIIAISFESKLRYSPFYVVHLLQFIIGSINQLMDCLILGSTWST